MTITVKSAPTISSSGGTDVVYTLVRTEGNTNFFAVLTDTDLRIQRTLEITISRPYPSPAQPNGYSQMRAKFYWKEPVVLANGKITVNGFKQEIHFDVETAAAVKQRLLDAGSYSAFTAAIKTAFVDGALLT